ncbi:unnamed protein product [Hyaloperonospora brassicae]|uniref:FYVE-type domain-containing protein n=1 Tax=Hyaloperonospora brassicae TaxID=162125 RepID=A0AAV0V293_HYABA|nr:unnamed protein product [Hyaloperonospora brassicae]
MPFFSRPRTEAERADRRARKELERLAKTQRKYAAMEHKAQEAQRKQQEKLATRREKEAQQQAKQAQREAAKARKRAERATAKRGGRLARQAARLRGGHRREGQDEHPVSCSATASQSDVAGAASLGPFANSAHCAVCGKKFGPALHRRRHHCRQCRASCCVQCTSQTRHVVPQTGRTTRQKVCVVCDTLIFSAVRHGASACSPRAPTAAAAAVREPAEAIVALAAAHRRASAGRRPRSAPLPQTAGVAVARPCTRGPRARASQSSSRWQLLRSGLRSQTRRAERVRNGGLDLDLQLDKRALFMGRAIALQPQAIAQPAMMRAQGRDA